MELNMLTPTIIDMKLQVFCSQECEVANDKYWEKIIAGMDDI